MTTPLQKTDLNTAPYFDDYNELDSYHRILFKPRAVQAREVNQLQSILQNQINRFGKHVFEEGSSVIDGGSRIIDNQNSIEVVLGSATIEDLQSLTVPIYIRSNVSGLSAVVQKIVPASGGFGIVLFVDYQDSGTDNITTQFAVAESCIMYTLSNGFETNVATATISTVAPSVWFKLLKGVYFVRGHFVLTDDMDIVLSRLTTNINLKVGFSCVEAIIDETMDEDLYSNALGYPNFKGIGASRLKLSLELSTKALSDNANDLSFIELARFENGALSKYITNSQYSVLEKTLAQRTYEESGDYTVTAFPIELKEHLKQTAIDGVYPALEGGDASKLVVQVKAGVGYVKGYRVDNIGIKNITTDKARDTDNINNTVVAAEYGQYIIVNNMQSVLSIDITKRVQFLDSISAVIGTCAIRAIRAETSTSYRVYIFDIIFDVNKSLNNAVSLYYSDVSNLFSATLVQKVIFDSTKNGLVFKLPYSSVSTLKPLGVGDTTYSVLRSFDITLDGLGNSAINLTTTELFSSINNFEYIIADTGAGNAGVIYSSSGLSLGGSPTGRTLQVALGLPNAGKTIKIVAPVIKQSPIEKTKTLATNTEVLVFTAESKRALAKVDIKNIISITDTTTLEDVTDLFVLDNGQRSNWYEVGSISTIDSELITQTVSVEYQHFNSSAGDYSTVDSYSGLLREDIPSFNVSGNTISLSDCIDFRPSKDSTGAFTNLTVYGEIVKNSDNIRCDLSYYLNRIDCLYVDSNGDFGVIKGVSNDIPMTPSTPSNAMKLYEFYIPAYTADINKIRIKYIENKRYTMRDIGRLDKRISNVEYYTTLSELESKTNKTQVIDPITGNDRFKNGFAVDGFNDFRLVDLSDSEFKASIDTNDGLLKAPFIDNVLDLKNPTMSNVVKSNALYSLPYTHVISTQQPYATGTTNINPYAVFTWNGSIVLDPVSDFWKDTKFLDPIVINNTTDLTGGQLEGSVWSDWEVQSSRTEILNNVTTAFNNWSQTINTESRENTTTIINTSTDTDVQTNLISTYAVPFMRSVEIEYTTKNFMPFTRLYPFFDGVDVSAYCTPNPIVTDAAGIASGVFTVPNSGGVHFRTGTGIFKLSNSTNPNATGDEITHGEAVFTSGGVKDTLQATITNTRTISASTTKTKEWRTAPRRDPIAQTFRVTESGGAFISKVDIFFSTKAESLPVTLQIRTVENGLPTETVLPFAEKDLLPLDVTATTDASIASTFEFDDLVYLEEGKEYAIVLLADTQEYNVYLATMGDVVIGKQLAVSKQPHLGVFLSSSNGSTWNANQNKDLNFVLYRADFNIGLTSELYLTANDTVLLPCVTNPLSSTNTNGVIVVKLKSHGLKVGDSVAVSGATVANGIVDIELNASHIVTTATLDTFSFVVATVATATGSFGGSNALVKPNYPFTDFYSNVNSMVLPNTTIKYEYRYRLQSNRSLSNWIKFEPNNTLSLTSEAVYRLSNDFTIRATLSSTKSNLSPVIDTSSLSTALIHRRIDSSSQVFNYVTKSINFDNPSTSAKFFIGAKLPVGSTMTFYYKLITSSEQDLTSVPWVALAPSEPLINDSKAFLEYDYILENVGSFVGYKIKIAMFGNDLVNTPELTDFRSIALA